MKSISHLIVSVVAVTFKMSLLLLCFLFLFISLNEAKSITIPVDPDVMPKLFQTGSECIANTGLNEDIIKQFMEMKIEDNEPTKKLLFCYGTKLKYIDKKGHVIIDEAVKLTVSKKRKVFADAIRRCNDLEGKDKYDTLFKIIMCGRNQSNIHMSF